MTDRSATKHPWVLLFIAVALVALNMRMSIAGVGPLLDQIAADQGVPTAALGALGSLPLLAWAAFSPLAHGLSARFGLSNAVSGSLIVLALGTLWRSAPGGPANLWLGTAIIGAGLAVSNVLLPTAIKRDFPQRIGLMMGIYTALLGGMAALTAGLIVPVSEIPAGGGVLGWRGALLVTGVVLPFALGIWIWAQHRRMQRLRANAAGLRSTIAGAGSGTAAGAGAPPAAAAPRPNSGRRIWRDPLAWQVSVYMGFQSVTFYVMSTWFAPFETARGSSPTVSGLELMAFQLIGITGSLLLPAVARGKLRRWLPALLPALGLVSWVGIPIFPQAMPLWIVISGVVAGALLTLSLMLMANRARSEEQSAALSGMAQSLGYAIAALGPFAFGWLHALTNSWVPPFAVVWVAGIVLVAVGFAVGRPRFVLEPRG